MLETLKARLRLLIAFLETNAKVFWLNTRGEPGEGFTAPILMVLSGVIWVICIPIFADQVQGANTSSWNFTGAAGAKTLFYLMPFIFIAGGVIWIVKKAMGK